MIQSVNLRTTPKIAATPALLVQECAKMLGVGSERILRADIMRRSIDARQRRVMVNLSVAVHVDSIDETAVMPEPLEYPDVSGAPEAVIVGAGPAGLFAALELIQLGVRPIILERGKDVDSRRADMVAINRTGTVDPDSNYCFGEGGAGAYSDGKLYTRSKKRGPVEKVLRIFHQHGAQHDILVDAHPHIGTDRLPSVIKAMRQTIIASGGEVHFGTKVTALIMNGSKTAVEGVVTADGSEYRGCVILATGHSARDIYELFSSKGWALEAKGFALGVRVEHPQSLINRIQYHGKYQPFMPAAEYSFVQQIEGRGVFSFCMCPGGILVPSATSEGETVLNGMSNSARNSKWANSGVVVSVEPEDVEPEYREKYGPLSLMHFQMDVERKLWNWVQGHAPANPVAAPGQRMMDFCRGILSANLPASSYHPGVISAPLHELLPENVRLRLKYAFPAIGNKMRGYYTNDALVLGVESRTSSPVRIPRDPATLDHPDLPGLYPCGEGAGYAGGIVSSALDGINCAVQAAERMNVPASEL